MNPIIEIVVKRFMNAKIIADTAPSFCMNLRFTCVVMPDIVMSDGNPVDIVKNFV